MSNATPTQTLPVPFNAAASLQLDRIILLIEADRFRSDLQLLRLAKAALEAEHVPAKAVQR